MSARRAAVTTFDRVDGCRVERELGRVSACVERPRNRLRAVMLQLRVFLGLPALEMHSEAEHARRDSVDVLCDRAAHLGADAILGVRFRIGKTRDGHTRVMALGRAVLLHPPLPAESPSKDLS